MRTEGIPNTVMNFILRDLREGIPTNVIANTWGYSKKQIKYIEQEYNYFRKVWKPFKQATWNEE